MLLAVLAWAVIWVQEQTWRASVDAALRLAPAGSRDGDLSRLGPKSLDKTTRFVVDHAPCPVLLTWPGAAPGIATIPPPPPEPGHRPRQRP